MSIALWVKLEEAHKRIDMLEDRLRAIEADIGVVAESVPKQSLVGTLVVQSKRKQ